MSTDVQGPWSRVSNVKRNHANGMLCHTYSYTCTLCTRVGSRPEYAIHVYTVYSTMVEYVLEYVLSTRPDVYVVLDHAGMVE